MTTAPTEEVQRLDLVLPPLYPKQRAALYDPARYVVVEASTKSGKRREKATKATPKKRREWREPFLRAFKNSCNVRDCCEASGIHRSTAYRERGKDPAFAEQWDEAEQDGIELLEAAARQRALTSSDTLMIFLLKSHRPEVYRDRFDVRHESATVVRFVPAMGRDED